MSSVLIVDDSPADRALFRTVLSRAGFQVEEVATGGEALDAARTLRPHVIVLDVNLTDTDGHTVCRALRADPACRGIPVLMLTVRGHDADVLAGLEAGADDYVAKDSHHEIILARVRRLARYRQMANVSVLNEQLAQIGRLLAGIVHEIRGPLTVVRGNAELLRMHLEQTDPSNQWVEPIIRNTQILQARLEHLMAAVRSGPAVLTTLELAPLIREVADLFAKGVDHRAGRVTIEFRMEAPVPPIQADAGRLIQVLMNLLGNAHEAILSSRSEGVIRVTVEPVEEGGRGWVKLEVQDNGPGISPEHLDRIFEPFYTTKEKGSGYGLYLASEIIREHGGMMSAFNAPEGGACIRILLPASSVPGPTPPAPQGEP